MPTIPVSDFLYQHSDEELNQFQKYAELLEECFARGTHIYGLYIPESEIGIIEGSVLVHFRQGLSLCQSMAEMVKVSNVDALRVLLRSQLEISWLFKYLLMEDRERRAHAVLVCYLHREIQAAERLQTDSSRAKNLNAALSSDTVLSGFKSDEDQEKINSLIERLNDVLSEEELAEAEEEYQRTCRVRRSNNPSWFMLYDGPGTIEQLARYLGHSGSYETLYRYLSASVHSIDLFSSNAHADGLTPFQSPEYLQDLVRHALGQCVTFLNTMVEYTMPEKEKSMAKWLLVEIASKRRALGI